MIFVDKVAICNMGLKLLQLLICDIYLDVIFKMKYIFDYFIKSFKMFYFLFR